VKRRFEKFQILVEGAKEIFKLPGNLHGASHEELRPLESAAAKIKPPPLLN
jgi:hypothetical protein